MKSMTNKTHSIYITSAEGTGPTELAAFDNALMKCGVHNMNLIPLSSVIPPSARIKEVHEPIQSLPGSWGDRLYVVQAEMRTHNTGEEIWAGIGWVVDNTTGEGLFVEHHAHSEYELSELIKGSLTGLMQNRNRDFGKIHMRKQGTVCKDKPVCVYAVAAYQVSDWNNNSYLLD